MHSHCSPTQMSHTHLFTLGRRGSGCHGDRREGRGVPLVVDDLAGFRFLCARQQTEWYVSLGGRRSGPSHICHLMQPNNRFCHITSQQPSRPERESAPEISPELTDNKHAFPAPGRYSSPHPHPSELHARDGARPPDNGAVKNIIQDT